ncbi:hypothetical protein GCM10009575_089500 [Streptomyces rhizosphaericus]|uniref:Purine catabolism PurC-like domain-containing protein n=1 Tax=Streptomyces rhizosphaericus TaxID=114699 RepID=A0ABN1RJ37_9ACTN
MPPTLASLVRHPGLKLSVLAGEDRLETPVRWAHVSELADPVPYMEGGELLLITAMQIEADDPEEMSRYVRRLVGAGVVGLGFALGVNYAEVPPALATAAKEEGLPLLGVPRRTPFIAISKAVSAAIAADQYRAVTAGFEAQRELTRAAIGAEGPAELRARLAAHVDGWAALYDVSGAVVAAAPDWAARRAARLTPDVERLRSRPGPGSIVVGGGCGPAGATGAEPAEDTAVADRVELQSLGTGRRTRGVLAVGTGAPLGTAERYAVHSAVALLTLTTERSRALQEAEQRLGAAVLRMLLAGEPDHARAVAGRLYGGLLDAPFRMLVAEVPSGGTAQQTHAAPAAADEATAELPTEATTTATGEAEAADPLGTLIDTMEAAAARIGESVLVVPDGERLIVLASDDGAAVAAGDLDAQAVEARRGTKARPRGPHRRRGRLPPGGAGAVGGAPPRPDAGRARAGGGGFRTAPARRRRRQGVRRRHAARPARARRHRPGRSGGLGARLALPARSVGRGRRRPRRPPAHPALPDAPRRGDPGPLPGRPGRPHGAVAGPQGHGPRHLDLKHPPPPRAAASSRSSCGDRLPQSPRRALPGPSPIRHAIA